MRLKKKTFFFLFNLFFIRFIYFLLNKIRMLFRCLSSNIRLAPLCRKQPPAFLLSRSHLSLLKKPTIRRSFTTTQICREEIKPTKKPTNSGDVKKLFRLAKPELRNITAATGLLVVSSAITMVNLHHMPVLHVDDAFLHNKIVHSLFNGQNYRYSDESIYRRISRINDATVRRCIVLSVRSRRNSKYGPCFTL
ncbi:MAG: hypothetical protein EXX96DRAFT_42035 [Benjaminiella poitrasii]|nr:MAG: hypothetical protein EXX96DRAFT_42035 [Benjaminiella poitrasii]